MKTLIRLMAVAVIAAAFVALTQRRQISAARTELAQLEADAALQTSEASAAPAMSSTVTADDIARLRAENRDIHKLRGQISQAREKRRALEQMQAQNAQLRQQIDRLKANPDAVNTQTFPLENKGAATPENALETTFWSMYQGDIEGLSRTMPMMTHEFERMPPAERTNNITLLRAMASTIAHLEVLERKLISQEEAHLTVRFTRREEVDLQLPTGRDQSTFILRRTNDLWQVVAER